MPSRDPRRLRPPSRRGSAGVEFALSLPMMVTLTAALIDWGEFFTGELVVVAAARDAARSAVAAADPAGTAEQRARDALTQSGLDGGAASVTATVVTDGVLGLETLTLTIAVARDSALGLVISPTEMRAETTVLLEPA